MAMGIAAIANGGNLMKPQLIKEVVDKDGTVVKGFEPTLLRQVVSKDVAKQVAWTMTRVTKFGTGKRAQLEHFHVGGKTGTAQKVNPETRRYDPNMWIASFVGFAPAEDPEFVVLVMVDEPQKMHYGGVVAGPAFKKIMSEALTIRGVRPPPEDKLFTFDDEELEETEPLIELETESLPPIVLPQGDGFPDFRGLTLREALDKSRKMGILPGVEGWGKVVAQTPEAGSPIEEDFELSLVLSPASRQSLMAEEPSSGNLE
jgi:cell division protein FtsI (penicillin-binding protein 3)